MSDFFIEAIAYAIVYSIVAFVGKRIWKAQLERKVPEGYIDHFDMKAHSVIVLCCGYIGGQYCLCLQLGK